MELLFQVCVIGGVVVLVAQIALELIGLGGHAVDVDVPEGLHLEPGEAPSVGDAPTSDALSLLSVRAVSAATAVYGAAGLALVRVVPTWLAVTGSLLPALLAALLTAWVTRQMLRMQVTGTLRLQDAVGSDATVYLTVPAGSADGGAHGLIHLTLQGRTVELAAVTREPTPLPAGSSVVVLSVTDDGELADVVPASTFEELIHDDHV